MQRETSAAKETGHRDDSPRLAAAARIRVYRRAFPPMPHLEEITYDLGRAALAVRHGLGALAESFALDVGTTYVGLREKARDGGSRWLVTAGLAYEELRHVNRPIVRLLETRYLLISIATMMQLLLWIGVIALA